MAHLIKITHREDSSTANTWDPKQRLAKALRNRSLFLEQHPQHKQFQSEIDHILDKAGSTENRMAVLSLLMEAKLIELQNQFHRLQNHFRDMGS